MKKLNLHEVHTTPTQGHTSRKAQKQGSNTSFPKSTLHRCTSPPASRKRAEIQGAAAPGENTNTQKDENKANENRQKKKKNQNGRSLFESQKYWHAALRCAFLASNAGEGDTWSAVTHWSATAPLQRPRKGREWRKERGRVLPS